MTKTTARSRAEMRRLDDMPSQLAALETMNVPALAEKYRELYGEPTRSRHGNGAGTSVRTPAFTVT